MNNQVKHSPSGILQEVECSEDCECYRCSMDRLADHQAQIDSQIKDEFIN